jgi:hypothetical protein
LRKGKLPADTSNGAGGRVSGYCANLGRKKQKNTSVMLHRCAKKRPDDESPSCWAFSYPCGHEYWIEAGSQKSNKRRGVASTAFSELHQFNLTLFSPLSLKLSFQSVYPNPQPQLAGRPTTTISGISKLA